MSVELDDRNIGESQHNLKEKYYLPIVPNSFVNPLFQEAKSSRPDMSQQQQNYDLSGSSQSIFKKANGSSSHLK